MPGTPSGLSGIAPFFGAPVFFGERTKLVGQLPWGVRVKGQGRVVHIDRFGNLITDLPASEATLGAVRCRGHEIAVHRTYEDVASGEVLAYPGSARTIEIAVRDGRADDRLAVSRGELVEPTEPQEFAGPYR